MEESYISLTEAAKLTPYSQEYLSLRARQGKLKASKQGRNWFTTLAWLNQYLNETNEIKAQRKAPTVEYTELTSSIEPVERQIFVHHPGVPEVGAKSTTKVERLPLASNSPTGQAFSWLADERQEHYLERQLPKPVKSVKEPVPIPVPDDHFFDLEDVPAAPLPEETADFWRSSLDPKGLKKLNQTLSIIQPLAASAIVIFLMVMIPILNTNNDLSLKIAAGIVDVREKVGTGLLALLPDQGRGQLAADNVLVNDSVGQVAGASTELTDYTISQKLAAGLVAASLILEEQGTVNHNRIANWLVESYNLPNP